VPSGQIVRVATELIGRAYAHSLNHYESKAHYLHGVYAPEPPLGVGRITCVTGLAGVGKSRTAKWLKSVLGDWQTINVDAGHEGVQLKAALYCVQGAKTSNLDVLHDCATQLGADPAARTKRQKDLIHLVRRLVYVSATCILMIDEAQLKTLSSMANTSMTHLLLLLREIGIPVVVILNFSMVNRLTRRNHEDRDRLLSDPIVFEPPAPESACFLEQLQAFRDAAPGALGIDLEVHAKRIHEMTAGLPRVVIELFGLSYRFARMGGSTRVRYQDMAAAYTSRDFSVMRRTVQAIHAQAARPDTPVKLGEETRLDLFCPFRSSDPDEVEEQRKASVRQEEVAQHRQVSSLSPRARAAVQAAAKDRNAVVDVLIQPPRRESVSRPKSAEDLLANQARYADLMKAKTRARQ
jgi:hypothetical protein